MIEGKEWCTGCMACKNICPVQAIGQALDGYGFVVPTVDSDRCIHCGKCEAVCPLTKMDREKEKPKEILPLKAYAMYHRSKTVVASSSSGGAFYALSANVLKRGGIVFGCYYDITQKKAYLADTDQLPLESLLTSKYVESYIGFGFQKIKSQLDTGREVLFCGTPCQAAGLCSFLPKEYENLLVTDFTCGAVSAQVCLSDYLSSLERRFRSKLTAVQFRDKHYGWGQYCFQAEFENRKLYRKTAMSDPYFFCFLRSSMQRLSCHGCLFSACHFSDLVLSDFWKCDFFDVDRNDRHGISLALAMTKKGQQALEEAREQMHTEELDVKEAAYNLKIRSCPKEKRQEIFHDQSFAAKYGVAALRRELLSPQKRLYYAVRQFVMDHPILAAHFPGIVGNGQIMK